MSEEKENKLFNATKEFIALYGYESLTYKTTYRKLQIGIFRHQMRRIYLKLNKSDKDKMYKKYLNLNSKFLIH